MNKIFLTIVMISSLISLTGCEKMKSFPKPKTNDITNKINISEEKIKNTDPQVDQVATYGKNSPIVGSASNVKGIYITHGDNSPIVMGKNISIN